MAARLNLTIPDDLKRRIDEVKDQANWSQVVADALEQKLGEIAARKAKKEMSDVVQRLKASSLKGDSEMAEDGHDAGRQWAADKAEVSELRRLEEYREGCSTDWGRVLDRRYSRSAYSPGESLYFAMHAKGGDDGERDDAEQFWDGLVGEGNPAPDDPAWLYGFVDGALELWDEVKHQL